MKDILRPEDFYASYADYKAYQPPQVKPKHIRWLDREVWGPAACTPAMRFLEIGCGTGNFLLYLRAKGVARLRGIDLDQRALDQIPADLRGAVQRIDVWDYLALPDPEAPFDRIVMLDVLEHFSAPEGVRLLRGLRPLLAADGRIVVRVPNMASPWGGQYQFGDLTHKTAFAPGAIHQLAVAAGYAPIAYVAERRGSRFRRLAEDCLHGVLRAVLTVTPPIWSANFLAVLAPRPDP